MLFAKILRTIVRKGRLVIIDADGRAHEMGVDADPEVTIRLHEKRLNWALGLNPHLKLGEAYMDGTLTVENGGDIYDFLDLLGRNLGLSHGGPLQDAANLWRKAKRGLTQFNPASRSRANVAHHYDLSGALYDLFLDRDRQYSCAYYAHPDVSLDQAQLDKKRHIAAKLALAGGERVLDIGCGWGGMGLYLAREGAGEVVGVTLSDEQLAIANRRAEKAGLGERVRFELQDYRRVTGRFERIVSVGMFEHVGLGHYRAFFRKIAELLSDDGVALIHTIGRSDGPGATNPWIAKYIFPGGYTPALSEVMPAIERTGMITTDVEILRLHYAETLREWRRRFLARRDEAAALYDERFVRMWEYYLAGAEMGFRHQGLVVFQIQLAKSIDALPLTRDYIADWERARATGARDDTAA